MNIFLQDGCVRRVKYKIFTLMSNFGCKNRELFKIEEYNYVQLNLSANDLKFVVRQLQNYFLPL